MHQVCFKNQFGSQNLYSVERGWLSHWAGLSLEGRRERRATGIGEEVHQDLLVEMGSRVCEEELRKKKGLDGCRVNQCTGPAYQNACLLYNPLLKGSSFLTSPINFIWKDFLYGPLDLFAGNPVFSVSSWTRSNHLTSWSLLSSLQNGPNFLNQADKSEQM